MAIDSGGGGLPHWSKSRHGHGQWAGCRARQDPTMAVENAEERRADAVLGRNRIRWSKPCRELGGRRISPWLRGLRRFEAVEAAPVMESRWGASEIFGARRPWVVREGLLPLAG